MQCCLPQKRGNTPGTGPGPARAPCLPYPIRTGCGSEMEKAEEDGHPLFCACLCRLAGTYRVVATGQRHRPAPFCALSPDPESHGESHGVLMESRWSPMKRCVCSGNPGNGAGPCCRSICPGSTGVGWTPAGKVVRLVTCFVSQVPAGLKGRSRVASCSKKFVLITANGRDLL